MKASSISLLQELNDQQREAVESTEGPVLILAGAGSGKTRVLTYRIAYLILEKKVAPWEILAMTFTKKAASEMRERVKYLVNEEKGLWIGTFHSIFSKILRWEGGVLGYDSDFVIYDSDDQERLVKSIMKEINIVQNKISPKSISSSISLAKNCLISPDMYYQSANDHYKKIVSRVFPEYQKRLRTNNAFDFDDLITIPIQLFTEHTDVLTKYQSRFKYILVDEYQDTNLAQYRLVHHLAREHRNLCVVGDDDQSIYRWRGADLRNILDFEKDFPDSRVFRLEQNYRSTQNILIAAGSVVEKNEGRKGKKLWSDKELGEQLDLIEVWNERDEAQKVVEMIKEEVFRNKRTFGDFVILYRTNAQSRALEDGLRRSGMSYVIVGGIRFYERKEVKDVLAYVKLIVNPKDSVSLKRIINFPHRGIGDVSIQKVETWAQDNKLDLFTVLGRIEEVPDIPLRIKNSIRDFYEMIQKYINLKDKISPNELVRALVDETGLLLMYKEDTSIEGQGRAENIKELLTAISEYAASEEEPNLAGFLEEVSLISDVDAWDNRANAITLMTLHCAKGLEFPVVFITGLEEGLFPVSRSMEEPEAMEEERRLFYVGLTRAKEKIYLLWAQRRGLYGEESFHLPSRFIDDLDPSVVRIEKVPQKSLQRRNRVRIRHDIEEYVDAQPEYESFSQEVSEIRPGTWVKHEAFGRGQILSIEGVGEKEKVSVKFEGGVKKKFLVRYAKFTVL